MGLWDESTENEEFRDVPDETAKDYVPSVQPVQLQRQAPAPVLQPNQIPFNGAAGRFESAPQMNISDAEIEEICELEEDFSEVLNDANLRIEQGRLYQMIMNHDLFEGMDADPKAVQNVQREIRKFARERMEIMLGMRQEQRADVAVASPFNSLEVDILKKLASKATNGATETAEANQIAEAVREVPRRQTLKPLGGSTGLKKPVETRTTSKPAPQQKPLPSKPAAPMVRSRNDQIIDQILLEEGVSRQDLELEYVGIGKQLHELTPEELNKRQKETAARLASRKTVKSSSALPMATPEQEQMLAVQRATQISQSPGMSALLARVSSMPVKNP